MSGSSKKISISHGPGLLDIAPDAVVLNPDGHHVDYFVLEMGLGKSCIP